MSVGIALVVVADAQQRLLRGGETGIRGRARLHFEAEAVADEEDLPVIPDGVDDSVGPAEADRAGRARGIGRRHRRRRILPSER